MIQGTPTDAAERMRLHRERKRLGLRCIMIELRETEIDELIRRKYLSADMHDDAAAIRDALYRHLEQTLGK
jgi:hypothetical protein